MVMENTGMREPGWRRMVQQPQAGKALVPLLGVLAVLAMAVAAAAIVLQMRERDKRLAKEQELRLALAENDDLKARLDETQQARAKLEEELERTRKEFAQTQEKLVKAVEAQETLNRSLEDRNSEVSRLTKDLDQAQAQQKEVAARLSSLQTERDAVKQQLAELEQAKGELETKVMELSQGPTVELDKVLVTGGGDQAARGASALDLGAASAAVVPTNAASSGQVMVVNREYDFIVMNLGKNHGLSIGQELQVVRGNEVLGKVKVEKVYDELSAAAILPESKKESIREGDTVRTL